MQTVRIYRLDHLSPTMFRRLKAAQMEAAQVWNLCMETHKQARMAHTKWPGRNELQKVTKGRFAEASPIGANGGACLPCQRGDDAPTAQDTACDADEVSLANEALLSRSLACASGEY